MARQREARRPVRFLGIGLGVTLGVATVVAISAALQGRIPGVAAGAPSAPPVQGWGTLPGNASPPTPFATLPDVVWDLEYVGTSDTAWFVSGTGETGYLYRATADGVQVAAHLPSEEYSGVHHKIRALDNGDLLLNADYSLIRYSVQSRDIRTLAFTLETDDALPGALSSDNPLPGTWVSSFTVQGSQAFVARNNVPYLTVIDIQKLQAIGRIPVGSEYAGAVGVAASNGFLYLAARDGNVGVFEQSGQRMAEQQLGAVGLLSAGNQVLATAVSGQVYALTPSGFKALFDSGWQSVVEPAPKGTASYDAATGQVDIVAPDGSLVERRQLPDFGEVVGTDQGVVHTGMPPNITDLAVANDGSVWFVLGDSPVLWKVGP